MGDWILKAPAGILASVYSPIVFNGAIYVGAGIDHALVHWDGISAWLTDVSDNTYLPGTLTILGSDLFGSLGDGTRATLVKWSGANSFILKADEATTYAPIRYLAAYLATIYAILNDMLLWAWDGVNSWIHYHATGSWGPTGLVSFLGSLYATNSFDGELYQLDGTQHWVSVAPRLNAASILSIIIFSGALYAWSSAGLYRWNGSNAWVQITGIPANVVSISDLTVLNGELYGVALENTFPRQTYRLYKFDGVSAWIRLDGIFPIYPIIGMPNHQLVVFNNHLYNAADDANLYVYGPEVTTDAASLVTGMTAVLNGNLVDGVGEVCDCGFEWGLTPAYGHTTPTTPQNTGDSFAQLIAGLLPATTYHFRAFATNTAGTNDGSDMIFTTPIFVLPPPNLSYPISRRKL